MENRENLEDIFQRFLDSTKEKNNFEKKMWSAVEILELFLIVLRDSANDEEEEEVSNYKDLGKMSMENNMSEADYLASIDIGDCYMEEKEKEQLYNDKLARLRNLNGKYIVVCDGKKSPVFLQDRGISKASFWTKFPENAFAFSDKNSAISKCREYKYNNPRVCIVENGRYRDIK